MRALLLLLAVLTALPAASENDWFVPLGPPPKAAPKRISGGESFPPLPLPATPLRRSERKKSPSPPPLLGKLVWGEAATFAYGDGNQAQISDWNLCPGDLQGLLGKARGALGQPYGSEQISLATFHGDPERLPALVISGVRTLALSDDQALALRQYVQRGGMVICDSVAGSPYFTAAARKLAERLFPDRALRPVPSDHPLLHMAYDIDKVAFPRNAPGEKAIFEAVHIGSRIGVLISPAGLGCGWDDREVPLLDKAVFYDVDSAVRIGINLVAYVMAWSNVGREEAKPELFGAKDERRPANEFVFAQVVHDGHWDALPGTAVGLLDRLAAESSVAVSRKRIAVRPGRDDLGGVTMLWLTGLDDFRLPPAGQEALRAFIARGGTLVVDNALGLAAFDAAARRELAALLPGSRLARIPPGHALFSAAVPVRTVQYAPAVLRTNPDLNQPFLEGISVGEDLRVIYSPFGLGAGWDGVERTLARTWLPASATAMGMNLVVYGVTH